MSSTAMLLEAVTTFGAMVESVKRWIQEPIRVAGIVEDAVNDAYEELWMASILATLGRFTQGAVPLTIATAKVQLISVQDPTANPTYVAVAGGALPARTYWVSIAYVTESGTTTLTAPAVQLSIPLNNLLQCPVQPPYPAAFAFMIYAGETLGTMVNQTPNGVQFNQSWTEPTTGINTGDGQPPPVMNTSGDNIFAISSLQVQNQDGTYNRWEAADVSSSFIQQQQLALPTGSSYQRQAYDLLGGGSLQIFPGPGASFPANYWYIAKPRRMMFYAAPLPFNDMPNQSFIRQRSLADTLGHLSEFQGMGTWQGKADKQLAAITKALTVGNRQQNNRVRPYIASY
jgi:hypothetical protein